MSFEPDPSVATRIKAEAARLAEQAVDLVDDAKHLSEEFVTALKDLAQVCEPADFTKLVIDHLPASMQERIAVSGFDLPSLLQMVPDLKAAGMQGDEIRRHMLDHVAETTHPYTAAGFRMGFPEHGADHGHTHVVVDSLRARRLEDIITARLALDTGTVKDGEHTFVLCQLHMRGGLKAAGALRKHESGLLLFVVEGKGPNGQTVQVDHFLDYDDIQVLAFPHVAPAPSPIVSG